MDETRTQEHYPVQFTGRGGQYFKIWIVNILLTIVTLYIYSAWAKIRTKRYFYGNTVINGSSFEYHAKPLQILLSRIIAALLLVAATLGGSLNPLIPIIATGILFLIIPWAIWRSTIFNMRMTSYRNVRFGFDGSVWPVYVYQFLLPLFVYGFALVAVVGGVYYGIDATTILIAAVLLLIISLCSTAFGHQRLAQYFLNHYLYGNTRFSGLLTLPVFIKIYLLAAFIAIGLLVGIIGLVAFIYIPGISQAANWMENLSDVIEQTDEALLGTIISILILIFYLYMFTVGYFVIALIRARVRNHIFAQANLGKSVSFKSNLSSVGLFGVMFTNLLILIVSLGFGRPYTQVRMAKYFAKHSTVISATSLNDFVGDNIKDSGAFGDELGDAFDVNMDVGF